jgi:predicted amidohydrolase YtcJ
MKHIFAFSIFVLFLSCSNPPQSQFPNLIFVNGNFFTADSLHPQATAIAIAGDRILAVGNDAEIKKLAGKETQIVDLQGAFAMPGFIEGHGHFNGLGESLQNLNLINTKSWAEITGLVAEKAKSAKPGEWIEGRGWHQEKWSESSGATVNGYPYNNELSAISANNPVILYHASGHGLIANAKAIELAGISSETSDPMGGRIVRDARGKITGVFEENAMGLIEKPFYTWKNLRSEAEQIAAFEKSTQLAAAECLAKGISSFQDAGSNFWELAQYRRLAEADQLPLRLWVMASQPTAHDIPKLADFPQVGLGNQHFTCRAVKCYFDGALGFLRRMAACPYDDKPGFVGQNTTPLDTITRMAQACHQYGLQLCVHAIGDRANREVLNVR